MFPSFNDFGVASILESLVLSENPGLPVEFRVMVVDKQTTSVSYGFKKRIIEDPKKIAEESFQDYLQYACPVDLTRKDPEVCNTHPEFFLWPSDKYFLRYRGVVKALTMSNPQVTRLNSPPESPCTVPDPEVLTK